MGLGKTIQSLALILAHPSSNPKIKATLIVAPPTLLKQWQSEIEKRVQPFKFNVVIYHGTGRTRNITEISKADIVLTSYSIVHQDFPELNCKRLYDENDRANQFLQRGPLGQIRFHRIILDEAHSIKNRGTNSRKLFFN